MKKEISAKKVGILLAFGLLLGVAACGKDDKTEKTTGDITQSAEAVTLTATPEPTATTESVDTPTLEPTPTAEPTPTKKPEPTPTPAPIPVENTWYDNGNGNDMSETEIMLYCPNQYQKKSKDVPYGEIVKTKYYSTTCEREKNLNILLPAGYSEEKKYPVVYVLHGVGGDGASMIGNGESGVRIMIGNMIAEGAATDMIVVFPDMFTSKEKAAFTAIDPENMAAYDNFVNDLADDLMPFMAKNYSVAEGRDNTAVVGFSMGGRESLCIGFTRPDLFGYVGAVCPAPGLTPGKDMFLDHVGTYREEELVFEKESPYFLMICGGDQDFVVGDFPEQYHNILTTNRVNHHWWIIPGATHGEPAISAGLYNFFHEIF